MTGSWIISPASGARMCAPSKSRVLRAQYPFRGEGPDLVEQVEEPQSGWLGHDVEDRGPLIEVGREFHRLLPALDDVAVGLRGRAFDGCHGFCLLAAAVG